MRGNVNYFAVPGLVNLKELRINTVKNIVLKELGVTWEEVISKDRQRPFPEARQMLSYFINKYCGVVTSTELGRLLSRDHSAILYYFRKVNDLKQTDGEFKNRLERVEFSINQHNVTI